MAQKRATRIEKINQLAEDVDILKADFDSGAPHIRSLSQKIKDVQDGKNELKSAHIKYISDEKTTNDEKNAARTSYREAMKIADDVLFPALDMLQTMEAADTVTPAQQLNIERERVKSTVVALKEKIQVLKSQIEALTNPHKAQLDRLQQIIDSHRTEVVTSLKESYKPLYDSAKTEIEVLALDEKMRADAKPLNEDLDALQKLVIDKTPASIPPAVSSTSSSEHSSCISSGISSTYKFYQKSQMPKFDGKMKNYPKWKKEYVESILPGIEESRRVRLLDDNTPESIDLQNCETAAEAWEMLDARFGNRNVISASLIENFIKYTPKGRSPEAKLVDLRDTLSTLKSELKAVNCLDVLTTSTYHMQLIVKLMPRNWQNKWSETKETLIAAKPSEFEALISFVKDEAVRIETDLPWTLESGPVAPESKKAKIDSSSNNIDVSKLPKNLQRQINAALSKNNKQEMNKPSRSNSSSSSNSSNSSTVSAPKSARFDEMAKKYGKCPLCKEMHTYVAKVQQLFVSSSLLSCEDFRKLDAQSKAEVIEKNNACAICCSWAHKREDCTKIRKQCGKGGCNLLHHVRLHGTKVAYVNAVNSPGEDGIDGPVLLPLVYIRIPGFQRPLVALLDFGSDSTFINTHAAENHYQMKGKSEVTILETAGNAPIQKNLPRFNFEVLKIDGTVQRISCLGLDSLTSNTSENVDVSEAYALFPHVPRGALDRPKGNVELLIGNDYASLLAYGGESCDVIGQLRAMKCPFGTGWVLIGHHPSISGMEVTTSSEVNSLRCAKLRNNRKSVNLIKCSSDQFPDLLDIPLHPPRKCNRCKNCQSCRYEFEEISRQEQKELELIRQNTWLNKERQVVCTKYPLIQDPSNLPYNEWQASAISKSLRKSLEKQGLVEEYEAELKDYIKRGVISPVSRADISNHQKNGGIVCFISHHPVIRRDKATTKVRLVSNSSLKIGGKLNLSPNDLWPKGPNTLKPMIDVLLRFRCNQVGLHFDISKMYHSVETSEDEKFLRLMVWPYQDGSLKIYGPNKVAMGDRPAAAIMEEAKDLIAEEGREIDTLAATVITEDTYIDDGGSGGDEDEVKRMIGETIINTEGSLHYTGTIQQILSCGGFRLKMMIRSGQNPKEALEKMGEGLLGHLWNPEMDTFTFDLAFHAGKRGKDGRFEGEKFTGENLQSLENVIWTRRMVLSAIASQFDPTGLIAPLTVKLRIFMRKLLPNANKLDWDAPLELENQKEWNSIIKTIVLQPAPTFPRRARPYSVEGPPEIVAFSDGSSQAYCSAIYLRWPTVNLGDLQVWESFLLTAKCRVTPVCGISIPRSEMNGLLASYKLVDVVLRALRVKPVRVHFLVDSTCIISAMKSVHGHLSPYLANRRGQIDEYSESWKEKYPSIDIEKPVHIAGERNIADIGTRGLALPQDLTLDSEWQQGPSFLALRYSSWPLSEENEDKVPDEELLPRYRQCNALINKTEFTQLWANLKGIFAFSEKYDKCIGILARVLRTSNEASQIPGGWNSKNEKVLILESLSKPLTKEDYKKAETVAFQLFQNEVNELMKISASKSKSMNKRGSSRPKKITNMSSISPFKNSNNIWVTKGRFGKELGKVIGPEELPILPTNCLLSKLLMVKAHQQAHHGGADTFFRSKSFAWIVRGRPLADRVARECKKCPILWKNHLQQQMGNLPPERLRFNEKPWTACAMDLFGPFLIKSMTNKRSQMKIWPVVFGCFNTGALHCEISAGYSTDDFLRAFSCFTSLRGLPDQIYTDKGTQLCRASDNVQEQSKNWDWGVICESSSRKGTTWRFCPPGSQWRNGLAEARVRAVKEAFEVLLPAGANGLNYAEFETVLRQACNIINDRPLAVKKSGSKHDGEIIPITPNTLLLGRTSLQPPSFVDSEDENRLTRRMKFVEEVSKNWWNLWFAQVWQDLFPRQKWKEISSNLSVGDICMKGNVKTLGKTRYTLCRVTKIFPDENNLVRTVEVASRPRDSRDPVLPYQNKDLFHEILPVQKLVLIARDTEIVDDCPVPGSPQDLGIPPVQVTQQDVEALGVPRHVAHVQAGSHDLYVPRGELPVQGALGPPAPRSPLQADPQAPGGSPPVPGAPGSPLQAGPQEPRAPGDGPPGPGSPLQADLPAPRGDPPAPGIFRH